MREIIIIEKDDDMRFHRPHPRNPLVDGWICPYCGKRVYSMEVHPCNQPYCGGKFVYEENYPEDGPFCWNYGGGEDDKRS